MNYHPQELTTDLLPLDAGSLAMAASQGNLVLFLGAGVSAAPPSAGPMGSAVADIIRPTVAGWIGESVADLQTLTLESLASRVYAHGPAYRSRLQQLLAESGGFREMPPNYAHRVAAHLLREGAASVVTTNWDQALESAAQELGFHAEALVSISDDQSARTLTPVRKLHGCASVPASLRVSQAEIDQAGLWSEATVRSQLVSNSVVFIGYGTVANYVREPIERALSESPGYAAALTVVSRSEPEAWRAILEGFDGATVVGSDAETFLDRLLCQLVGTWLDRAKMRATVLEINESWGADLLAGVTNLMVELGRTTADGVLRWWRSPASSVTPGQAFAGSDAGVACLIAAGYLVQKDGGVDVEIRGSAACVATSQRYVEIVSRPAQHFSAAKSAAESYVQRRHDHGVYDDGRPITIVLDRVDGSIPAFTGEPDIAADGRESVNVDSQMMGPISYLLVGDVMSGRIA